MPLIFSKRVKDREGERAIQRYRKFVMGIDPNNFGPQEFSKYEQLEKEAGISTLRGSMILGKRLRKGDPLSIGNLLNPDDSVRSVPGIQEIVFSSGRVIRFDGGAQLVVCKDGRMRIEFGDIPIRLARRRTKD